MINRWCKWPFVTCQISFRNRLPMFPCRCCHPNPTFSTVWIYSLLLILLSVLLHCFISKPRQTLESTSLSAFPIIFLVWVFHVVALVVCMFKSLLPNKAALPRNIDNHSTVSGISLQKNNSVPVGGDCIRRETGLIRV